MRLCLPILLFFALGAGFAQDGIDIARDARAVLKKNCSACHHGEGSAYREFDVLKYSTLVNDTKEDGPAVVVPKNLKASLLWQIAGEEKRMPPKKVKERPSDAELSTIKAWIEAGAPPFPTEQRAFITQERVLTAIRDDLRSADRATRGALRYFTLAHLNNNPQVLDEDLRLERGALSMAINSLTWRPSPVLPRAIDKEETIFAINIKDLDWDHNNTWTRILQEYPYGLDYVSGRDEQIRKLAEEINDLTDDLVIVRADWFCSTATRPPLYYDILYLPATLRQLEHDRLNVNAEENFVADKLMRSGFAASGVSSQNRLVERHESSAGVYYYKSFDFKPRNGRSNLNRFPLGPKFNGNEFNDQAFVQDGGEMIFGLPNGLQAYYLVDGKGNRINDGPIDVVSDDRKTSGTPTITNGLSCMYCHKSGTLPAKDTVRNGHGLSGVPRDKVERLYVKEDEFLAKLKSDEDRFVTAFEKIAGPYLTAPGGKQLSVRDVLNPVGESARRYLLTDINVEMAAYELGMEKPEELAAIVKSNSRLQALGLMPLANGKLIKRSDWESIDGFSLYQAVARELKIGSPLNHSK